MGARFTRLTVLGVISIVAFLQSSVARAQSTKDGCSNPNPDATIAYCTVVIETEISDLSALAGAYINRGLAYVRKGQYGPALKDYAQAIKYQPGSAVPYNNRCYALAQLAKLDDALADCQ